MAQHPSRAGEAAAFGPFNDLLPSPRRHGPSQLVFVAEEKKKNTQPLGLLLRLSSGLEVDLWRRKSEEPRSLLFWLHIIKGT